MRRYLFPLIALLLALPAFAAHQPMSDPPVRVGILMFDGVQIIDFAGPYEVFGNAGFGVVTVSPDGKPVTTAMGLKIDPDTSFAKAPPFDILLIPGGDVADAQRDTRILDFVRERSLPAKQVLSVCTGAFILSASGLLDGDKATTFTPRIDELAKAFPKVHVIRDVRWADNGKLVTSAGLSSGIDAALHVVAKIRGVDEARTVALRLEYDWKPEGGFVRSRFADRYLTKREVQSGVDWPKDATFDEYVSAGDMDRWVTRYHVRTATAATDLLDRLDVGVRKTGLWKPDGMHRWLSRQENRDVTLTFTTKAGSDASHYDLDMVLVASPAKQ
ncbi:DJ-1/PfpI family protein [Xanthomonas sp. NCPPB 2632]|uniref:DJ-1/PfpI family protein n=1 Tax=Xanthomonas sp. NCPPB 2632 TaxID=3240912 RepID=UPI0035189499